MGSLSDDRKKRDEERRIAGLKKEIQKLIVIQRLPVGRKPLENLRKKK